MADNYPDGPKDFYNEKTGEWESFRERTERLAKERTEREAEECRRCIEQLAPIIEAKKRAGLIPLTQKEQRELNRKKRQEEEKLANLTRQEIRDRCYENGECKVTRKTLQNAFPEMISQIGGNAFRTNIDSKLFDEFLLSNCLTFTLPDYVFKKRV